MSVSTGQQVKPSQAWRTLSGHAVDGIPLMESKAMNVQLPSIADLAHSLPSSWKGDVCSSTPTSPSEAWLMKFWGLVRNTWKKVPDELTGFMVVPLIGSKFASPAFCQSNAALSKAHLKSLPANTADILSAVGCLCIAQAYADSVSCITATDLPIIAALGCVRHLNVASSLKKLGQQKFEDLRRLLAYHILLPQEYQPQVWSVVRQCSIFEAAADIMTDLRQCNLQLMPNAAWERSLLDTSFLVPWKIVMYHTASALQQKLLKLSGLNVPELPDPSRRHSRWVLASHCQLSPTWQQGRGAASASSGSACKLS